MLWVLEGYMADLFPAGIRRAEFRGKQNKLHSVRAYRKQIYALYFIVKEQIYEQRQQHRA